MTETDWIALFGAPETTREQCIYCNGLGYRVSMGGAEGDYELDCMDCGGTGYAGEDND